MEDYEFIKNYINQTMDQNKISFLQRKVDKGVSQDPEDEIRDQIDEIRELEHQLKNMTELANHILEQFNKTILEKDNTIEQLETTVSNNQIEIEFQKQSINQYQKFYHEQQEKNGSMMTQMHRMEQLNEDLQKNEKLLQEQIHKLQQQEKVSQLKQQQSNEEVTITNLEYNEIFSQNEQLKQEISDMKKTIDELTFDLEFQIQNQKTDQSEIKTLNNKIKALESRKIDCDIQIKELQEYIQEQKDEIEDLQATINEMQFNQQNLQTFSDDFDPKITQTLETETDNQLFDLEQQNHLDNQQQKIDQQKEDPFKKESLQIQMDQFLKKQTSFYEKVDFTESKIKNEEKKDIPPVIVQQQHQNPTQLISNHPLNRKHSTKTLKYSYVSIQTIQHNHTLKVKKDPLKEFFDLTAQTVKLNSPLLDEVLCIDTREWYQESLDQQIPYHKWYVWIDKRIHQKYYTDIRLQLQQEEKNNLQEFSITK